MPNPLKQPVAVELFYDGAWRDVTADDDVLARSPITITRGQSAEGNAFRPCSVACTLDNTDDRYRTSNPMSPLYGKAGLNTPTRVSVAGTVRGTAEASSWTPDQTRDFRQRPKRGSAWVDLEAGGILQRIGQWSEKVRSPFYLYNSAIDTSVGYWPMEHSDTVQRLFTPTPGARSNVLRGVEFGSRTRAAGSAPTIDLPSGPGVRVTGQFAPNGTPGSTLGWQISFTVNFGDLGETGGFHNFALWTMTNGVTYGLSWVDGTDLVMDAFNADNSLVFQQTWDISGVGTDWRKWQVFIVQGTYSAGTTTATLYWNTEGSGFYAGPYQGSFSGVPSSLLYWSLLGGGPGNESMSAGHLIGTLGTADSLTASNRLNAWRGHPGETAAARFARLCALKNIAYTIIGTPADSMPMGPQQVDTFTDLLKEIVTTEDALLFDDVDAIALVLMLRGARYNQTPALELVPADLPVLPKEPNDDLGVNNYVTVSQRNGDDYTAVDETGPLGTAPPPDGAGEYRQDVDVNLADQDQLPQLANWWLRRGTVNLPRFPQVTINLAAMPGLIAAVEAVDVGNVITITGMREYVIRLQVIGIKEVIGTHSRTVTFTCVPDQQFVVGVYDSPANRYDLRSCTLNGQHDASTTTLALRMTEDEFWSTTATPYDLLIAGELVRVTAMGARTGTGPWTQPATVRRSVNEITKTLPAGSPVRIAIPGRYAL